MADVTFKSASRLYQGSERPAVDDLDLHVNNGEFLVLVGPSGCGKSTTLRMLAGLEPVDGGSIWIGNRDVTDLPPKQRDIAMVFQNYGLYPHMTVAENMGFALRLAKMPKPQVADRVGDAANLLDLGEYLVRLPRALSGGQRQRVAMGRAIVREPQVFLMDEPLSNLDAKLRVQTRTQIASLQRRLGITTIYVTHDQTEAMTMGHRVAVMKDGVIQQLGTPRELYDQPANVFVAGFIGSPAMNLLQGHLTDGGVVCGHAVIELDRRICDAASQGGSTDVTVGLRPEDLRVSSVASGIAVEVGVVEALGADAYVYGSVVTEDGAGEDLIVRVEGRDPPRPGSVVFVEIHANHVHLFNSGTGQRIVA